MNENNENLVLQAIVENPRISLREIENNVGVVRLSAGAVLKSFKYHPYREQLGQGLHQGDGTRGMEFCQWFSGHCDTDPDFTEKNCGLTKPICKLWYV